MSDQRDTSPHPLATWHPVGLYDALHAGRPMSLPPSSLPAIAQPQYLSDEARCRLTGEPSVQTLWSPRRICSESANLHGIVAPPQYATQQQPDGRAVLTWRHPEQR